MIDSPNPTRVLPVRSPRRTGHASKIAVTGISTSLVLGIVSYMGASAKAEESRQLQAQQPTQLAGPTIDPTIGQTVAAIDPTTGQQAVSSATVPVVVGAVPATNAPVVLQVIPVAVPVAVPPAVPGPPINAATPVVTSATTAASG